MTLHIRNLLPLLIVACSCSIAAAEHVTYAFESAETGLYGEITFEDTNPNFAPGGTATVWNGAVVHYRFERDGAWWELLDQFMFEYDAGFFIQFNENGTGPDDIVSYGYYGAFGVGPSGMLQDIYFIEDPSTNGNFEFEIWEYDFVTYSGGLLVHGTDGAFSVTQTARDQIELFSAVIEENGDVSVEYSKGFAVSTHLYRESPLEATHDDGWFGMPGVHVVHTWPGTEYSSLTVGERVFLADTSGTVSETVTVTNRPVADAGPDQQVSCNGDAVVLLDGTGSYDPNGDAITMEWLATWGAVLDDPTSPMPLGMFPTGVTSVVTLIVTDEHGAVATDDVLITVTDDGPPEVACTTDTATLTPANGEMVAVEVTIAATDACDDPNQLQLDQVTLGSSEPDDARGKKDGSTTGDTHGSDGYVSPVEVTHEFVYNPETAHFEGTVLLRAESDKDGAGRDYTINASVIDTAGNTAHASCIVEVPTGDNTGGGGNGGNDGRGRKK